MKLFCSWPVCQVSSATFGSSSEFEARGKGPKSFTDTEFLAKGSPRDDRRRLVRFTTVDERATEVARSYTVGARARPRPFQKPVLPQRDRFSGTLIDRSVELCRYIKRTARFFRWLKYDHFVEISTREIETETIGICVIRAVNRRIVATSKLSRT